MKRILSSLILILASFTLLAQSTSVTNVTASQRVDGSMLVDISYDLEGAVMHYEVLVEVSFDSGINYFPANNVSGDVGPGNLPGLDKHIIWNFGIDYPDNYSTQTKIRISAEGLAPWICGDTIIDSRDNKIYNTVVIQNQCWMVENLNIGTMITGTQNMDNDAIINKYCYDNNVANCNEYGGLYQWYEAMDYTIGSGLKGICPYGWHIPTDEDWKQLEGSADSQYGYPDPEWDSEGLRGFDVAKNLKSTSGWFWGGNGTGLYGFNALPGGYRGIGYWFNGIEERGTWWSSSEESAGYAWNRDMIHDYDKTNRYSGNGTKLYGQSVRCLKDEPVNNVPPNTPSNPKPENDKSDISTYVMLLWECSDPNGNSLSYNIYFGDSLNQSLIKLNLNDTFYFPGVLSYNTEYFWKVVAYDPYTDSIVGPLWSFTTEEDTWNCTDSIVDDWDGQIYRTVTIGSQCWMAENLNKGIMINGDQLMSDNSIIEKYCYDDDSLLCNSYGGLYLWDEIMKYSTDTMVTGICPQSWHIPTDYEWMILEGNVDSQFPVGDPEWHLSGLRGMDAGLNLKSANGWINKGNGNDLYKFTALPTGYKNPFSGFSDIGIGTFFWTSNIDISSNMYARNLYTYFDEIGRTLESNSDGLSVRCIHDSIANIPPSIPSNPSPGDSTLNIYIDTVLSWYSHDPEYDVILFNIYFGDSPNPPLIMTNYPDTFYTTGILNYNTDYYWKIVAHDAIGNSMEGPVWTFKTGGWTCGDTIIDARDSQVYNTVAIGSQCWMAENLNIGLYINSDDNQTNNSIIEKYCFDDFEFHCNTFGGLYDWDEMMEYMNSPGIQGICPTEWHIPTDAEWKQLEGEVDSQFGYPDPEWNGTGNRGFDVGLNLKSTSSWESGGNGVDMYGFNALPAGYLSTSGLFNYLGRSTTWWTSDDYSYSNAWYRKLSDTSVQSRRDDTSQNYGYSLRCIRNVPVAQ